MNASVKEKTGKRCRNHCCYHERNDKTSRESACTQKGPVLWVSLHTERPAYTKPAGFKHGAFQLGALSWKANLSRARPLAPRKVPSPLLPSPPTPSASLRLSSCSSPPRAASASLPPVGASFPAPSSSAPLAFLLEFAKDAESVCINCPHRHDGNKKAIHR